jgi:hypothetical protein
VWSFRHLTHLGLRRISQEGRFLGRRQGLSWSQKSLNCDYRTFLAHLGVNNHIFKG